MSPKCQAKKGPWSFQLFPVQQKKPQKKPYSMHNNSKLWCRNRLRKNLRKKQEKRRCLTMTMMIFLLSPNPKLKNGKPKRHYLTTKTTTMLCSVWKRKLLLQKRLSLKQPFNHNRRKKYCLTIKTKKSCHSQRKKKNRKKSIQNRKTKKKEVFYLGMRNKIPLCQSLKENLLNSQLLLLLRWSLNSQKKEGYYLMMKRKSAFQRRRRWRSRNLFHSHLHQRRLLFGSSLGRECLLQC